MKNVKTVFLALIPCLLIASFAWALSEQEVTDHAELVLSDLEALELDVEACPDGLCAARGQIEAELEELEAELNEVQADRDALEGCGCQTLDAALGTADALEANLRTIMGGWEEN